MDSAETGDDAQADDGDSVLDIDALITRGAISVVCRAVDWAAVTAEKSKRDAAVS